MSFSTSGTDSVPEVVKPRLAYSQSAEDSIHSTGHTVHDRTGNVARYLSNIPREVSHTVSQV